MPTARNANNEYQDRTSFNASDTVKHIWTGLGLPTSHLSSVQLDGDETPASPSSFKIGHLAQASIALSALAASVIKHSEKKPPAQVTVPLKHAVAEFDSEKHYSLNSKSPESGWGPLGGLHKAADGHVRMHDSFPNHRKAACETLGLDAKTATKEDVSAKVKEWKALDLEKTAMENAAIIYALRSYEEWDSLPQALAVSDFPITIRKISDEGSPGLPSHIPHDGDRCLRGLRVLEFSRVIAAPVAGRTLAAHGADVLWVTSPNLPSQPVLDIDVGRGKRTIQLDLNQDKDVTTLHRLVKDADVFIQSYRPGSFRAKSLGAKDLAKLRPGIVYANLNAWGDEGPWARNRGFDSIVQTVSGMNISEAEHFSNSSPAPARPMPCQELDHAAGYFLATGISAALYKRIKEGGSWEVTVSLAGVMKYLRSLGQFPGNEGFEVGKPKVAGEEFILNVSEERETGFGRLRALKHSARVEGQMPGWDVMPKELGSDEAKWL